MCKDCDNKEAFSNNSNEIPWAWMRLPCPGLFCGKDCWNLYSLKGLDSGESSDAVHVTSQLSATSHQHDRYWPTRTRFSAIQARVLGVTASLKHARVWPADIQNASLTRTSLVYMLLAKTYMRCGYMTHNMRSWAFEFEWPTYVHLLTQMPYVIIFLVFIAWRSFPSACYILFRVERLIVVLTKW